MHRLAYIQKALTRPVARDRRGAAAVEFVLIAPVLMVFLLSVFDLGLAALRFIDSYETLRYIAAYAIYNPPPDVTNPGTWLSAQLPTGVSVTVQCGGVTCSAANATVIPKTFKFAQNITVASLVVPSLAGTYTVTYFDRFQ